MCSMKYRNLGEQILLRASGEIEKELCTWEDGNLKPCPHCDAYQVPDPCPSVDVGMGCALTEMQST